MTSRREPLERIAAALDRIAPPVSEPTDWLAHSAYVWTDQGGHPVPSFETVAFGQLRGIKRQKELVRTNLERLANGAAAHDMLLWGARGMGKSALVRAATREIQEHNSGKLALVQVTPGGLKEFPKLIETLGAHGRAFLLFLDDLGFDVGDTHSHLALRSLLDGGVIERPSHVRLAVTSNRRAIVRRDESENLAFHERDERDDALALADRFGLNLGFHPCDQKTYLEILRSYIEPLGLAVDEEEAIAWAIARGNRSGRTAYQFACEIAGRAGKNI